MYPDEDICVLQKANQVDWVRQQRKIIRKTRDLRSFYTHRMLEQKCVIGVAIQGIDAGSFADQKTELEKEWIKKHPVISITDELRESRRLRGKVLSARK